MILSIFILALILTTVFWGYIAMAGVITKDTDRILFPAFWGIIVYFIGDKIFRNYFLILLDKNYTSESRWLYAIMLGLISGISVEVVRNEILYVLNKYMHWSGKKIDNIAFAIGYSWSYAIFAIGLYAWSLYSRIANGTIYFEIENGPLFCLYLEVLIKTVLCIGITFILQYGIIKRKKMLYTITAIVIRTISEMLIYAGKYILDMPKIAVNLVFLIFAGIIFYYGYTVMSKISRSNNYRKRTINRKYKIMK